MSAGLTTAKVRANLRHLDAELYDDTIPFEATAARLLSVTETVAQMVAANLGRLPDNVAVLIAKAQHAVFRRDLLAAREFIIDALNGMPRRRLHPPMSTCPHAGSQSRPHTHMRAAKFRSSRPVKLA